ncbi:hypothetical protein [Streptomonospora sediminis]
MVDTELLTTGLIAVLAGIALVLLGALAYIVHEAAERRRDARAGVPAPGESRTDAPGPETGAPAREHQPA